LLITPITSPTNFYKYFTQILLLFF